ncbi:MAG TPA: glycosyltransferase family 2 protein [Ignavibacteria bacterium]|nr:glycosyltransferase family 2 protein [Ignavibacteria bacterium]
MNNSDNIKIKLSVIILTKNNESTIGNTLNSVFNWVDEVIILDSGSQDNTLQIAEKFNCKIFYKEFNGFGEQKNYAVSLANNDWILILDSDEVITTELKNEIHNKLFASSSVGFLIPITLVFLGKIMKFGRENKMLHLRLFNRKYGNYNSSKVHENVVLTGATESLKNHILHYSYANLYEYFEKFNRYTSLASEDLLIKGRTASSFEIILRFPIQFFQTYFIHRNFLNGYTGFIWSLCSAFYPVIKLAKLKNLRESKNL